MSKGLFRTINKKRWRPLGWWFHRALCAIGWQFRHVKVESVACAAWRMYHKHLNAMCDKYGINLYGEPIS